MTKDERKFASNLVFKTGLAMIFAGMPIAALLMASGVGPEYIWPLGIIAAIIKFFPMKGETEFYKQLAKDEDGEEG